MGKPSRRQRKQLKEKRVRAESLGLPVVQVSAKSEQFSGRQHSADAFVEADEEGTSEPRASVSTIPPATAQARSWPLSIWLLLVGIFVLIGIGLYRRYTEDDTPSGERSHHDGSTSQNEGQEQVVPPTSGSHAAAPHVPAVASAPWAVR